MSLEICVWKRVAENNQNGKGTSFIGRTRTDLACFDCEGTREYAEKIKCNKYAYRKNER